MQKGKKKPSRIIQLGKEWSANSALHGVQYVGEDATHTIEKLVWVLIIGIATGFALYMCLSYWNKWEKSPILTSVDSSTIPLKDIPFPAFTVCNVNKVSKRRLKAFLKNPRYKEISYDDMRIALRIMTKPDLALPFKFLNETVRLAGLMKQNNINSTELLYIMKKIQTPCEEILLDCTWQDNPADCAQFFIGRATDDGYCCSFNAIDVQLYLPEVDTNAWDVFYEETMRKVTARETLAPLKSTDYDASFNSSDLLEDKVNDDLRANIPLAAGKELKDTSSAGVFAGLTVLLDGNIDDYCSITTNFDGFKILLHNKEEFPDVSERGFILGLDNAVYIGVEAISFEADQGINSVKFEKRMCYYEGETELKFFDGYSVSRCMIECLTYLMMKNFSCRPYFYPVSSDKPICGLDELPKLALLLGDARGRQDEYCPNCYPSCSEMQYKAHMSYSPFPGAAFNGSSLFRRLRKLTNFNEQSMDDNTLIDYARNNMIPVSLFFQDKVAIRYKMEVRYGWEDFVSAMGGLLGLGLGFSVIACIEIFYFICFRWCFEREHRIRPGSSATLALQAALQNVPQGRPTPPSPPQYSDQHQQASLIPATQDWQAIRFRRRRYAAEDALANNFYTQPTLMPNIVFQQVPMPIPIGNLQPMFMPRVMTYNPPYRNATQVLLDRSPPYTQN